MAVKKFKTHSELAARELAERNYTSLKQIQDDLGKIADQVNDNLSLLKNYQKRIETASDSYVIDLSTPNVHKSPVGKSSMKPTLVQELERNFLIVKNLWELKQTLGTVEARARSTKSLGADMSKAISDAASVRKQIDRALAQAGEFLANQATKTAPAEFTKVVQSVQRLVSRSLAYADTTTYTYLFPNGPELCYTSYIELKDVMDDKGVRVPEMYVVISLSIGVGALGKKTYYMDVLHEFEPPSPSVLTSVIDPAKMATVATELADLLQVSHFANSIKRIPIRLLIAPDSLDRELFSFSEYVQAVESDPDTQQLNFYLKPTTTDKALIDKIQQQLYLDTKALLAATRARMRVAITEKEYKGAKCTCISFFILRGKDAPAASVEDLEFLKERFNLSDKAINNILVNINKD